MTGVIHSICAFTTISISICIRSWEERGKLVPDLPRGSQRQAGWLGISSFGHWWNPDRDSPDLPLVLSPALHLPHTLDQHCQQKYTTSHT